MPTRRRVAVLAHCPKAIVHTSTFNVFIVSRMATTAYGDPPAQQREKFTKENCIYTAGL